MKKKVVFVLTILVNLGQSPTFNAYASTAQISISQLSVGATHGLILTEDNELYAFGNRYNGNFGDNNQTNALSNRLVKITTQGELANEDFVADPIKKIEANNTMSALLTTNGDLYLWGGNETGSIGNGTTTNQYTPLKVNAFGDLANLSGDDYLVDVSLNAHNAGGNNGVLALTQAGRLFYWGAVRLGMSGDGSANNLTLPKEITTAGHLANLVAPDKLISISAGTLTLGVVSATGRVFTWGFNSSGRAVGSPSGSDTFTQNSPLEITSSGFLNNLADLGDQVVSIKMNQFSGMVKTQAGRYVIWGLNTEGQAGQASRGQYSLPVEVTNQGAFANLDNVNNESILQIEAGASSYAALTSLGNIYTWGWNNQGALGNNSTDSIGFLSTPINTFGALANLNVNEKVTKIFKQNITTLALTNQSRLIGWGPNGNQLFFGSTLPSSNIPVDLTQALNNGLKDPFQIVIDLIDALPALADLTLEDANQVEAARSAYDALSVEEKALVTNYQELLDAEAKLVLLQKQLDDQNAADAVIDLIDLIPNVNNITLEDEDQVIAAREAYDALTEDQKALVTNYQELLDAEAKLVLLQKQLDDQIAADAVIALINALPSLEELQKTDTEAVAAARAAYDALSPDQQSLVTNEPTLVLLEARIATLNQSSRGLTLLQWLLILIILFSLLTIGYWFISTKQKEKVIIPNQPAQVVSAPVKEEVAPTITKIELGEVVLNRDIKAAPQFAAFSKVAPGSYLEITPDFASTNRVVDVSDTLPKVLNETNRFIALTPEEVKVVKLSIASGASFMKKTPGSYIDQEGYYVEVDLQNQIVDNYIFAKTRLAPTTTKGHRWIRIETRKIQSK